MNLEQIEAIVAKNLSITDQRLMDGVIGAVLDAVAAEREACAKVAESYEPICDRCPSGVANAIRARGEK
jgi:hypothetical protein